MEEWVWRREIKSFIGHVNVKFQKSVKQQSICGADSWKCKSEVERKVQDGETNVSIISIYIILNPEKWMYQLGNEKQFQWSAKCKSQIWKDPENNIKGKGKKTIIGNSRNFSVRGRRKMEGQLGGWKDQQSRQDFFNGEHYANDVCLYKWPNKEGKNDDARVFR